MATKVWLGTNTGNEGDWATDENWLDANGAVSVQPVTSDDVYFTSGSQDVTTGLGQSAVTLGSLNFGTKWTGSIETALEINSTTLDYASKVGVAFLEGTFTTVNVQATSSGNPALKFEGSTIATINLTGGTGTVLIDATGEVSTAINMIGAKGATLQIDEGADVGGSDLTIDEGRVISYEELNTAVQYGGVIDFEHSAGTTVSITIYEGTCRYKPTADVTLTTLTMYGGFFDMRGCTATTHTITNSTLYSGSLVDERNGLRNAVYTNAISAKGGIVKCDLGREVTIT